MQDTTLQIWGLLFLSYILAAQLSHGVMSLVVIIEKMDIDKARGLRHRLIQKCEGVIEKNNSLIFIPQRGELISIVKLVKENKLTYEIKSISPSE